MEEYSNDDAYTPLEIITFLEEVKGMSREESNGFVEHLHNFWAELMVQDQFYSNRFNKLDKPIPDESE